jgi:hypothetical protein
MIYPQPMIIETQEAERLADAILAQVPGLSDSQTKSLRWRVAMEICEAHLLGYQRGLENLAAGINQERKR